MILINLLPHREARRKQRKQAFFVGLGVAAGCGLLVAGLWYGALQQMTQAQQARNNFLRDEITKLEGQIKDIATLRAEIDSLKARQGAVEDLQLNRNVPVHLLDELVRPKDDVLPCVADRWNADLAKGFPAKDVHKADRSFTEAVKAMSSCDALKDCVRRTYS